MVLYADTPLLNKAHLVDLLEFVDRKRMNVCKLKRGFVFRNDYVLENSEFYSIDEYDFSSNDFLQVNDYDSLGKSKEILSQKIIDFHRRNGVQFENERGLLANSDGDVVLHALTNAISGCGSDDNELKQEMEKLLVDKQDSVFLDNGKYVAATTEFTDEEAVVVCCW